MLRLTDTRGSRWWPAVCHASRKAWICSACCRWKGLSDSLLISVELCRFRPSPAAHVAVCRDAAPHQMRSRSPVTSSENYALKIAAGYVLHPSHENDSYYFLLRL